MLTPKLGEMRHQTGHPEWGFVAPAPNFIRAVRIGLVAAAVGATIGAGVVLSRVDSSANQTSVAARTLQGPLTPVSAQVNPEAAITATSDAPGKATATLSPAAGTGSPINAARGVSPSATFASVRIVQYFRGVDDVC